MSNEIKKGDKVRVAKDAPKILFNRSICNYPEYVFEVREVEDGNADIYYGAGNIPLVAFVIPTKYLVKVDAEAKEAKFKYKVGQKVILHFYGGEVSTITEAFRDGGVWNKYKVKTLPHHIWNENELDPYTEPTEQTEAKTKPKGETLTFPICFDLLDELESCDSFVSIRERMRKALKEVEAHNKPRYVPKIMFNTEFWVKYEADLAKEVVLKVANKYNDPGQAAEYATDIAKAVVEGLKRK